MEQQIKSILSGLPGVRVKQTGGLWQVSVGGLSGARQNGESLARDLRRQYEYIRDRQRAAETPAPNPYTAEPEVVDVPMFLQEPVLEPEAPDPRDAEIAALRAALADKEAGAMFDTAQLQDLIRENETHSEAQLRWQSDYNQLMNRIVDSRLPPLNDTERRLLDRLQRALYAGRKGAVGIV